MFDHVCGPFGLFSTDCREKKSEMLPFKNMERAFSEENP